MGKFPKRLKEQNAVYKKKDWKEGNSLPFLFAFVFGRSFKGGFDPVDDKGVGVQFILRMVDFSREKYNNENVFDRNDLTQEGVQK